MSGFTTTGLDELHSAMATAVSEGQAPGLVLALHRHGHDHVQAIGTRSVDSEVPMRVDSIFRITSMTKPIGAAAALTLVDDGVLDLEGPVDDLLPELARPRVLVRPDAALHDTVPARRSITLRDLLTFRNGFGMILAPTEEYPVLVAEQDLGLRSVGPPTPGIDLDPDEWMRRLGSLPLMDRPGSTWRYTTASLILGVLVARAAGRPLEAFCAERIFGPLGMADTGFHVPAAEQERLVPCVQEAGWALEPFDDDGQWTRPPVFPDLAAGLVSTAPDYLRFARMLLAEGLHDGQRLISADLVRAMTTDRLSPAQRAHPDMIRDGRGWGFGLSIIDGPVGCHDEPHGYGWSGGFGTVWANDPDEGLVAVLLTQVLSPTGTPSLVPDFWAGVHGALVR